MDLKLGDSFGTVSKTRDPLILPPRIIKVHQRWGLAVLVYLFKTHSAQ